MIQSFHDEADLLRSNGIEAAYLVEVLVKQPIALPDDFGLSTANRNFNQSRFQTGRSRFLTATAAMTELYVKAIRRVTEQSGPMNDRFVEQVTGRSWPVAV